MAKKLVRAITLQLTVVVGATVGENTVETAINAALDEPPCDWTGWFVGAAVITAVEKRPATTEEREYIA